MRTGLTRVTPGQGQRSRIPSVVPQARKLFHMLYRHPVARAGHQCWTGGRPDRAGMEFWNLCQGVISSRILDATAPTRTPAAAANPDTTRTRWAMHLIKDGSDARWVARLDGDYGETGSSRDSAPRTCCQNQGPMLPSLYFFFIFF